MRWEAEHEAKRDKAEFEGKLLAYIMGKYNPKGAWQLLGGESPEDDEDPEDHEPVEELGTNDGFSVEEVDYMETMLTQFDTRGYAVEEID